MSELYAKLEAWCFAHRIWATAPFIILLLLFAKPVVPLICIGAALVILGEMGRTWASGYIDKNTRLATAGPYRFTRNPLYFFNIVILFGFCVMGGNIFTAIPAMAAFGIIYRPALRNEAAYVRNIFGEEYDRWAAAVPLFWPKWTNYPAQGSYSWALVGKHREGKNALAMVAGIALFVAIHLIRN